MVDATGEALKPGVARKSWRGYRRLPAVAQVAIAVVAGVVILAAAGLGSQHPKTRAAAAITPTTAAPKAPQALARPATSAGPATSLAVTAVVTDPPGAVIAAPAQLAPAGIPAPDPALTPGAVFPGVAAAQVCVAGYSTGVRDVPSSEKLAVYAEYHQADTPGAFEVDHLISLELGGSNAITNLWPEPYNSAYGAHQKDKVENLLHDRVCAGALSLGDAQVAIATHWWTFLPDAGVAVPSSSPAPTATPPPPGSPQPTEPLAAPPTPTSTPAPPGDRGLVHPGAFCSPDGATGHTSAGTPMRCTTTSTDSRNRWRAA
jgi:hypothetical protein